MILKPTEVQQLANTLAANVKFKLDYRLYIGDKRKLLIVEGATDEAFFNPMLFDNVDCIVAAKVFSSNNQFKTTPNTINCKSAIVTIITGISKFPSDFIKYPSEIDKWDLYGLVDSDFEESEMMNQTPRLFITDTHDLETLILSTDGDLLTRLEECEISKEDITQAFYTSYQLAVIRAELIDSYKNDINTESIRCGSVIVDFSSFVEDGRISVPRLIEYVAQHSKDDLSTPKIRKIIDSFCKTKTMKKKLDPNGYWKQSMQDFSKDYPDDFWQIVNGHDILQLLLYNNESAYYAFGKSNGYSLNRTFEMSLIATYDYSQFSKTKLFKNMNRAGVVQSK